MTHCPSCETLRDFLDALLPAAESGAIETHIETCPRCQHSLDELTHSRPTYLPPVLSEWSSRSDANGETAPRRPLASEQPLPVVPGYQLLHELGRGGVGVVYLARQVQPPRLVALKMLQAGREWVPRDRARFRNEAESLARLQHPNIIDVHEVGECGDRPYFTMEYIDGGDLSTRLRHGPFPPAEAALLVETLARAIHHAHQRGVIHRDLKPANVLLQHDRTTKHTNHTKEDTDGATEGASSSAASYRVFRGESLLPKITDFGLAKCVAGDDQRTSLTTDGLPHGTAGYLAPEQAGGRLSETSVATDVYSLGAILYKLLTGRRPYEGQTELEIILKTQSDTELPCRPSTLRPEVRGDLEVICLKCLEQEPTQRYAGAAELADDLRRYLENRPILARPASAWQRARMWARRSPAAAALVAVTLTTIVGLGVAGAALYRHSQAARGAALVWALQEGDVERVPAVLDQMKPYRAWVHPLLREVLRAEPPGSPAHLRAAVALLPEDRELVPYLRDQLLVAAPRDVGLLRDALAEYPAEVAAFWEYLEASETSPNRRLRAACALARVAADDPRWRRHAAEVTARLVAEDPAAVGTWIRLLYPVKGDLVEPLRAAFRDHRGEHLKVAASALAEYHADTPEVLIDLLGMARPTQFGPLLGKLQRHRAAALAALEVRLARPRPAAVAEDEWASEQANLAAALVHFDPATHLPQHLRHADDPRRRALLIHRLSASGLDANELLRHFWGEKDVGVRQAVLLSLGVCANDQIAPGRNPQVIADLLAAYERDAHPGVHSALDWLLRRWGHAAKVEAADKALAGRHLGPAVRWRVTPTGHTLALVPCPREVTIGTPPDQRGWRDGPRVPRYKHRPRPFAIGVKEVTWGQYRLFFPGHQQDEPEGSEPACPANKVTYYAACRYCNWLSRMENLPPEQWCYDETGKEPKPHPDYLDRLGYRLPTEEEWEYACRAGTSTLRYFGSADELAASYTRHFNGTNKRQLAPVGRYKPNGLGLFDTLGNVWEWCSNSHGPGGHEALRGGAYIYTGSDMRYDARATTVREGDNVTFGFRIVRSLPRVNDREPESVSGP